jgi:hypothetical protein
MRPGRYKSPLRIFMTGALRAECLCSCSKGYQIELVRDPTPSADPLSGAQVSQLPNISLLVGQFIRSADIDTSHDLNYIPVQGTTRIASI